ncbi:MAG: hypothetical protein R3332_01555 [Pseudohongiellaceae bacterium]|nr:hypothetical protein [Pseudohongiellaceae bacterium]
MSQALKSKALGHFVLQPPATLALACVFLLSFFSHAVLAQNDNAAAIEIISLNNRAPAEIREAVSPFLDPRGAISQIDNKLIISTTHGNLEQLKALISELDIPLKQLRISVDFHYMAPSEQLNSSTRVDNVSTQDIEPDTSSIVVTEGEYAYFNSNSSTPRISSILTDQGLLLNESQSPEAQSFAVTASYRGNHFAAEISTLLTQENNETDVRSSVLRTEIIIEPGQWHVLNPPEPYSSMQDPEQNNTTRVSSTAQSELIAIKLELVR